MMSRSVIPRFGRQLWAICPRRCFGSRRNLPMFWMGRRRSGDDMMPFGQRSLDAEMNNAFDRMQKAMSDRFFDYDPFMRPRSSMVDKLKSEAEVKYDEKSFEIKLDVQHYTPEELNVKLADDRLTITGKHEQKADEHGYVSREFTREFVIPQNIDVDTFSSSLSEDGVMIIQARVEGADTGKERIINIEKAEKSKTDTEESEKK